MTTTEALRLESLTKQFGVGAHQVQAVKNIDLSIPTGQIVALLGPNGAGKTTTVDMMLGLSKPTGGSIHVLGLDPSQAVRTGRISAVMQTGRLLRDMSVKETVSVIAAMHRVPDRVSTVMQRAGLVQIARRKVGKCSGGEQQRIKFALALLPDPDVLVLDEPTAGMDVMARRDFWQSMQEEADDGRTVIFATHYLEEAQNFAQRTVLMGHGRIIADGATDDLRKLISNQTVTATFADTQTLQLAAQQQGVQLKDVQTLRATFRCDDSDGFARILLNELGAYDLEIAAPSLEDAFIQLTKDES